MLAYPGDALLHRLASPGQHTGLPPKTRESSSEVFIPRRPRSPSSRWGLIDTLILCRSEIQRQHTCRLDCTCCDKRKAPRTMGARTRRRGRPDPRPSRVPGDSGLASGCNSTCRTNPSPMATYWRHVQHPVWVGSGRVGAERSGNRQAAILFAVAVNLGTIRFTVAPRVGTVSYTHLTLPTTPYV